MGGCMKGQSFRSLIACLAVLAAGQTFSDRIAAAPFNEEVRIGIKLTQLRPKPRLMRRDEVVVVTAESLFLEGTAYAKTGHYKQAIACYERAVQLRPDWGAAHYNLGWTYGQVDRWQEAAASCQRALRLEPSFEEAHFYLGLSYVNLNLYDEAIESYERAIKITDADLAAVHITRNDFHGEWNYTIKPQSC